MSDGQKCLELASSPTAQLLAYMYPAPSLIGEEMLRCLFYSAFQIPWRTNFSPVVPRTPVLIHLPERCTAPILAQELLLGRPTPRWARALEKREESPGSNELKSLILHLIIFQ